MALQDFGSLSLTNSPTGAQGKAGSPRAGGKTTPLDSATIDRIITEEGADNIKPTALGIYGQESTGGTNAVRSIDGAEGGMQVTPDTFKRIAKPGERIDNPKDNFRVGVRYLKLMSDQFGVDPARLAVGYFSGEGNVNPSGDTPYKVDKKDGNGKTVSSYVRDLVARVGGAVASEAKAAEPTPDISKAPKYRDFIAKPQWAGLDDSQKTQARDAYFDRYVAPHLAPAERDGQREAFLQRAAQIEGAGTPAAAKPGLLDRAVGAINGGLNAVLPSGGTADGDPAGTGAAEILAVAGPEASKIGVAGAGPVPTSPGASLAPVTPAFRAEVGRAFDAATPEQRQQMVQAEGVVGQLARERAGQFAAAPAGETASKFDTRAEARAERLTAAGANPKVAENFARYGAAAGQVPGTELGAAGPSNFDFETQERFNKDPIFSNPVIRAAVKGYEGYRQGSLGLAQALFDATGNQEFADIARQGVTDAQRTTAAIGERGDGLQRNFEGAVSSIAQQLPALLAGMATGTEVLPLAAMFTQTFGQEYGNGRAQGLDGGQAAARAGIYGAFEVIGEKFGLGQTLQALKLATRGAPTQDIATVLARGMLREIPGEQLTTLGQFLTDKVPGIGTNLEAGLAQYLQQAGDTLAQTVMQGGLMMGGTTGVSAGVRYLQGAPTQTSQEVEAERAREQAMGKAATFFQPPARPKHASTAAAEQVVREMAAEAGMDTADLLPAEVSAPAASAQPAQADVGAVPAAAEPGATDAAPPQGTGAAMPTTPAATPQAVESPDIAAMSDAILAAEAARGEPNGSASAVPAEPVDPRGVAPDAGMGVDPAAGRAGPVQGGDDGRASAAPAGVAGADVVPGADGAADGQSALSDRYAQAVDVVRKSRSPSVAVIQRNLQTDYSTAAGMLAQMERDGIVTTPNERGVRSVVEQAPAAMLDAAAHEAATSPQNDLPEPTEAQKQAGNYRMGHASLHGLDITIENPRGSTRSGTDADGKAWSVEMANHYGYLKRTEGADGDHVDVFIGPKPGSAKVFIVDQIDPRTGKFDEHKVLMGFSSLAAARAGYLANYEPGWKGAGAITQMSLDEFKAWLRDGDTTKPINLKVGKPKTEKQAKAVREAAKAESREERARTPLQQRADFGRATGAVVGAGGNYLSGRQNKPLGRAMAAGDFAGVVEALAVSKNEAVRRVGELARSLAGHKARIDNDAIESQAAGARSGSDIARLHLAELDALRAALDAYGAKPTFAQNREMWAMPVTLGEMSDPDFREAFGKVKTLGDLLRQLHGTLSNYGMSIDQRLADLDASTERMGGEAEVRRAAARGPIEITRVGGSYNADTKTITATERYSSSEQVVAHEVVHALTVKALDHPNAEQRPVVERIRKLMEHVKLALHEKDRDHYGMTSLHEFVAEGMSNPDFQQKLHAIKYESASAWTAFAKRIAGLLGIQNGTAFTELLGLTDQLVQPAREAAKAGQAKSEPEFGSEAYWQAKADATKSTTPHLKPKTEKQLRAERAEAAPAADGGKSTDAPLLKRATRPGRMAAEDLRAKFAPIIKQWANGPRGGVEVVQSVDDLPAHLAANLRAAGEDGRAQGFYLPKSDKVYLIADNLPSLERAQEVVFHEVYGHKGMRAILPGEQYAEMMGRIRRANPKIAAAASTWFDDYGDSTIEMNMAAGQSAAEARSNAELLSVEEALADMAATVPVAGPVRKLLAALQAGLRKIGLHAVADWLESKSEAETFALLRGARAAVFGVTSRGKMHVLADREAIALSRKDSAAADDYRFATEVMTELATHDELFKWPPSGAHTLDGVLADIDPTIKVVGDATREDERDESGAERRTLVRTSNGQDAYVFERGRDVWLDVSRLDPGSGGDAIYQAVANYALNARKRFIGDPAGLSPAAIVRRTYHMLGSALRFGTTEHFQPAPEQIKGLPDEGIPPLEWRGSDADKLAALAKNFADTLHHLNPELRNVRYDFDRAKFFDGNVEVARGDLPALAPRGSGAARAGSRTVAASVVLASLARATSSQKSGLLARALRQSGQLVAGDLGPLFSRSAGARWQAPDPTRLDRLIYELQDRQIDLKRVQTAIREQVGSIPESFDAYQKEESYHGRVAARTAQFLQRELRPLIEDLRVRKVSMEELEAFLWARHARERNAQIARINPDFPDGGSGLTDRQAASYFAGADVKDSAGEIIIKGMDKAKLADLKALAARVDAMNAGTQQVLIQYGLENPDTIQAWSSTYKHYVPLKREDMDGVTPIGQGFSVKGSASKRAMGSGRRVADILANVALAREAAITRGEKNRVTLALYGLALTNVNPGFWTTDKPPTVQKIHPTTGKVIKIPDPSYLSRDNVIVLRVRGEDRSIAFNEKDQRAMRIASSLKNLDVQPFGEIMGAVARTTRYLAAINTQYNPVFGLLNAVRDVQGAALNLTTTPISDKRSFVLLNAPAAMLAIWQLERHENDASPWAKLYEQLQLAGGTTGYREIFRTGKDKAEALQKEIDSLDRAAPRKVLDYTLNWLDHYNTAIENAIRLTAFKAALDKGLSEERAGSVAKNLTVNFNRRGRVGRELGSLYAFFNAAVQGTARMMETLDPRTRHGKAIIMGGIMVGVIQALVAAAAMDEDDWDAIPEFTKQRNFIIPMGKSYAMIPMPLGFNVLPNIGRILTEAVRTGGEKWRKQLPDLLGVLLDNANPMGSGTFAQILAPTVADPIVALAENKDFTGKPIFKEDQNAMRPKPGFQRAKDAASTVSKGIAYGANWVTGGTDYTPGLVSPTPDQLDYIFGTVAGGLGREINKVYQTTELMVKGKDVPEYKKPIIGRFYGDFEGDADTAGRYWNVVREVNEKRNEFSGRIKDGGDAAGYLAKHPELQLAKAIDKSQQTISKLRKTKDQIEQAPGMKEVDRTAAMEEVDKQTTAVMESIVGLEKKVKSK